MILNEVESILQIQRHHVSQRLGRLVFQKIQHTIDLLWNIVKKCGVNKALEVNHIRVKVL